MLCLGAAALLAMLAAASDVPSSAAAAEAMAWMTAQPVPGSLLRARSHLTIPPGHAEIIRYAQEPGTVIVGDATIAVASIAGPDILVLTGLRAGVTNVIVLDDDGTEIDQVALRVALPGRTIVVRRELERQVLRCDPRCAPTDESGPAAAPAAPVPAPQGLARPSDTAGAPGL